MNNQNIMNEVVSGVTQKIVVIQKQVDKIIEQDKKGFLQKRELYEFRNKVISDITNFIKETDDETQSHFRKITSGFVNLPKPGYTSSGEAEKDLKDIIDLINQSIARLTRIELKSNIYVPAGKTFDGRVYLQNIINTSQQEVFIIDNYLHRSILSILSSTAENKKRFIFKFLIGDKNKDKFDGFTSDLVDFSKQYPMARIECRLHDNLHDRYIIIDNKQLYTVGSSLSSIGDKGNFINMISDDNSKLKHMTDVLNLWNTATIVFPRNH